MAYKIPDPSQRVVAVLGAGVLGRRIACTWAAAGFTVHIRDLDKSQLNSAVQYIQQNISSEDYTSLTADKREPGVVQVFTDLAPAVKDAWLVIEAVPERLELKIDTMAELESLVQDDCIVGSNSSSYKSSQMVTKVSPEFKKRVCNVHYQMPPSQCIVEFMSDGYTHPEIIQFLTQIHQDIGLIAATARVESTGFIMNRIWAALKRETMMVLSEGVSTPEEVDKLWTHLFQSAVGPCGLMDQVGLDTVALIEDNYIQERGLSGKETVDWLRQNYIDKGMLGAKSGKGGLYPPGGTIVHTDDKLHKTHTIDNPSAPVLYVLDLGLGENALDLEIDKKGRVLAINADGTNVRELVKDLPFPDGLQIDISESRMFWTNMGPNPSANNGSVMSANLDGSDLKTLVKPGDVFTPKQLVLDQDGKKVYFSDREGMRLHRCDYDGGKHEILLVTGDFNNKNDMVDQTRWCVGISVDTKHNYIYWTQKGASKAGQGRIFRAGINIPEGESPESRSDIECLFEKLPEPIDLEIEPESETLYWTDRGEHPVGNTLNKAELGSSSGTTKEKVILARHFNEAIGLKIDAVNHHVYVTDLGGALYRYDLPDGKNKKVIYQCDGTFTGVDLAYVG